VVVITYYGESGRTVARYYLAAPDQYLVEQESVEYAEPITTKTRPVLKSRKPSAVYVCGKVVYHGVEQNELALIRGDLETVLGDLKDR
jgi:hypothetical protein